MPTAVSSSAVTEPPKTLSDQAYTNLREDIIHGIFPPEAKLRIEHLRKEYGVGATPLREALSRLTADGFVTAEGQRGFRVAPVSIEDLEDLTEMRILMEKQALRESIRKGDDAWESRIVATFYQLEKVEEAGAQETPEWEQRNRDFHAALISACTSSWLRRFYGILYDQHKRYRAIAISDHSVPRDLHKEHQELYEAALSRDPDRACAAIDVHIRRTADVTRQVLAEEAGIV